MFFHVLITILFLIVLGTLFMTVFYALSARGNSEAKRKHRKWGWITLWFTLAAVGSVETMVRLEHDVVRPPLFRIHLPCGIIFLLSLITLLKFNGEKYPMFHRILGYVSVGAYLCTFVTGMVLLWYY